MLRKVRIMTAAAAISCAVLVLPPQAGAAPASGGHRSVGPTGARLVSVRHLAGGQVQRTWTSDGEVYSVAGSSDTRLLSFKQTRSSGRGGSAEVSFGSVGDPSGYSKAAARRFLRSGGVSAAAQYADAIAVGFTPAQARAMIQDTRSATKNPLHQQPQSPLKVTCASTSGM